MKGDEHCLNLPGARSESVNTTTSRKACSRAVSPKTRPRRVAARTVNKTRAQAGEARESSRLSLEDISSSRRGGLRSHQGRQGRTYEQLYEDARRMKIEGRSKMTKAQLLQAVESQSRS